MNPSRDTRSTGAVTVAVAAAAGAAALVAVALAASIGASSVGATSGGGVGGDPQPVAAWSATDAPAVAASLQPVAVPLGPDGKPCAGSSYLSTQAVGAAAPAVRAVPATGP